MNFNFRDLAGSSQGDVDDKTFQSFRKNSHITENVAKELKSRGMIETSPQENEQMDGNLSNMCITQKSINQNQNSFKQTQNTIDLSDEENLEYVNFFEDCPETSSKRHPSNLLCDTSTVISSYKGSKIRYNHGNASDQKNLKQTMKVTRDNGIEDMANFNFRTNELLNSSSTVTDVFAPEVLQERLKIALSIFPKMGQSQGRMEYDQQNQESRNLTESKLAPKPAAASRQYLLTGQDSQKLQFQSLRASDIELLNSQNYQQPVMSMRLSQFNTNPQEESRNIIQKQNFQGNLTSVQNLQESNPYINNTLDEADDDFKRLNADKSRSKLQKFIIVGLCFLTLCLLTSVIILRISFNKLQKNEAIERSEIDALKNQMEQERENDFHRQVTNDNMESNGQQIIDSINSNSEQERIQDQRIQDELEQIKAYERQLDDQMSQILEDGVQNTSQIQIGQERFELRYQEIKGQLQSIEGFLSEQGQASGIDPYLEREEPYVCAEAEGDACHCQGTVYYGDKFHSTASAHPESDTNHSDALTLDEMLTKPYQMQELGPNGIFILCDYSVISGDFSLVGYQSQTPKQCICQPIGQNQN